jgi:hypothetical protein
VINEHIPSAPTANRSKVTWLLPTPIHLTGSTSFASCLSAVRVDAELDFVASYSRSKAICANEKESSCHPVPRRVGRRPTNAHLNSLLPKAPGAAGLGPVKGTARSMAHTAGPGRIKGAIWLVPCAPALTLTRARCLP